MSELVLSERPAPYSEDAEQAVIASVLSNNSWYALIANMLKPTHFFILRHQYIWESLERLFAQGLAIDYLTVSEDLRTHQRLDDIGGSTYLMQLQAPTSVNAETYARLILGAWLRRQMLSASYIIHAVASNESEFDIEQARAEMARQTALVMDVELGRRERTLTEIALDRQTFIEARMQNSNTLIGVPTGLTELDRLMAGLQPSDLTILGGVPGMGKTSLMLSILLFAAKVGKHVGLISQEMGEHQIWDRLTALESKIDLQKIRTGNLNGAEYRRYMEASLLLKDLPITIYDRTVTPLSLKARAYKWASGGGLDLLMVDYLQIMSGGGAFKPSQRVQEVGYLARSTKELAKEMSIPILCAAQLSREVTGVPELWHLRDSGEIEAHADNVLFVYRPDYYNPAERPHEADIIVAKQRNGPIGRAITYFDKPTTRFLNPMIRSFSTDTGEYDD